MTNLHYVVDFAEYLFCSFERFLGTVGVTAAREYQRVHVEVGRYRFVLATEILKFRPTWKLKSFLELHQ